MPGSGIRLGPKTQCLSACFFLAGFVSTAPDRWGIREPFSVDLVEEGARSGKRAAQLTGHSESSAPLMIQNSVPVEADQTYELSAWVKASEPGLDVRTYMEWHVGDIWAGSGAPWVKSTGEWQELKLRFETKPDPQGGAYVVLQIRGKGVVLFDDITVRQIQ